MGGIGKCTSVDGAGLILSLSSPASPSLELFIFLMVLHVVQDPNGALVLMSLFHLGYQGVCVLRLLLAKHISGEWLERKWISSSRPLISNPTRTFNPFPKQFRVELSFLRICHKCRRIHEPTTWHSRQRIWSLVQIPRVETC